MIRLPLVIAIFCCSSAFAKVPEAEILGVFNDRLEALAEPKAFSQFVESHPTLFPTEETKNPSMVVEKENLEVNGDDYTLAIGYRQVTTTSTNAKFLKTLWASPELFQKIYDLDAESALKETAPAASKLPKQFKARVFKKIPAIEDQDYVLEYTIVEKKPYTFIRAKLVEDRKKFALRDNLKVLEEKPDGMVIREISYLYPLKWYVRMLGPTARSTMKKELNKISVIEKCLVEKSTSFPPTDTEISQCTM